MTSTIPFIDLKAQRQRLGPRIDQAVMRVIEHGQYVLGPEVAELETALAGFAGVRDCVTCGSGTDALQLVLMAQGIGAGDAVFVPSFTFVATAEVVALLGATPVFVDIEADSFNMDPASLEAAIATARGAGLAPRGVIPVDLFGQPANYPAIEEIAAENNLWVLADAAQSLGAQLGDMPVGRFGIATATSFFPAKPLGCYGDGGAVLTDDTAFADILRSLRVHGFGRDRYHHPRIGMNARMDTIQAAVLLEKLRIFPEELAARQRIARQYSQALEDVVEVPRLADGATSSWAQYTIRLPGGAAQRARVQEICAADGIPTAVYYPIPLHRQEAYTHFPAAKSGLGVSEMLAEHVLSLPMHPYLDDETQGRVVDAVRRGLAG